MKKYIALLIVFCVLMGTAVMPVGTSLAYSEDPLAQKNYEEFGAEYTEPLEEEAVETEPEEIWEEEAEDSEESGEELEEDPEEELEEEPQEDAVAVAAAAETLPQETTPPTEEADEEPEDADEPKGHHGVPLYFQTDYPNNMYGMGTIANNGCSAACLAMVATYLTGHEYFPDEIARYFGGAAENNIARLEEGSRAMKLPFKKMENWHKTLAALHEGKIAIVLVESNSIFTDSQHFIVVTGFNEDGKLMVNDSYEPNYDKWDTKKGLREGFAESDIVQGYSGAWVYDKKAMPKEPFLYSEPLPVRGEPRYDFELTWEEIQLLAKVVWVEARGESNEGQQAVAEVVLNRLASDGFADTLKGVVYAENQFRSAKFLDKAEPYQLQYEMIENALYGPYVLPEDVFYFATTAKTEKVWGKIGGHIFCYADN